MNSEDLSLIKTEDSYQGWEGRVTKTPARKQLNERINRGL